MIGTSFPFDMAMLEHLSLNNILSNNILIHNAFSPRRISYKMILRLKFLWIQNGGSSGIRPSVQQSIWSYL